jgi:hypothetical protein
MPLARGVRVQVVHIFCSPGGLASQPSRTKADQRDEAIDAGCQDGYYDDVHPPLHAGLHNLPAPHHYPRLKAVHRSSHREASPVPVACQNEAATVDIKQYPDDEETGFQLGSGSWPVQAKRLCKQRVRLGMGAVSSVGGDH